MGGRNRHRTRNPLATLSREATLVARVSVNPAGSAQRDRQLVTPRLSDTSAWAMQHRPPIRARPVTPSLTLQRSMLAPTELPAGFAARYEPAGVTA